MKRQLDLPFTVEELGKTRAPLNLTEGEILVINAIRCSPSRVIVTKNSLAFVCPMLHGETTRTKIHSICRELMGKLGISIFSFLVRTVRNEEFEFRVKETLQPVNQRGFEYQVMRENGECKVF